MTDQQPPQDYYTPRPMPDAEDAAPAPHSAPATGPRSNLHYTIHGHDIQFVEINLQPGEAAIAEVGALMYMDNGIQMNTRMGDGSQKNSGVFGSILSMGKRYMAGESVFITFFTNNSNRMAKVAFAASYPGTIIPFDLRSLGTVMCQKDGFLCGTKGVSVGMGFTKRVGAGMLGGDGYVLEKLSGDGLAFINAGGSILERELAPGETIYVESGSIVAFQNTVDFSIKMVQGMSNVILGSENLFLSTLKGPGRVWIQSMPFFSLVYTLRQAMIETMSKKENKRERKRVRRMTK